MIWIGSLSLDGFRPESECIIMKKTITLLLTALLLLSSCLCLLPISPAAAEEEYDTSLPTYFYDFSQSLYDTVMFNTNFTMKEKDGYLNLTALQDDPHISLTIPSVPLEDLVYASFGYRLHVRPADRYAEVYYSTSAGEDVSEKTKIKWAWTGASDEWSQQTVYMSSFDQKPDVYLTLFRFDALAGTTQNKIVAGEAIDLAYIAFFRTQDEADRFHVEEYRRYLAAQNQPIEEDETESKVIEPGDWQIPTQESVHYTAADQYDGSLEMTHHEDGTLTISYLLNGERVSYTVPDTPLYACGPLVGVDDLGRSLWDPYTVVDPDYTALGIRNTANGTTKTVKTVDAEAFTVGTVGERNPRQIGMFYFLNMSALMDTGIRNISEIMEQYGADAGNADCEAWGPVSSVHHFAEPLYGYYFSNDTWVMRKHAELLTNAGVDFLYFDTTNMNAYTENAIRLMAILHEFNLRGYDAPQVCFYTHTGAVDRVKTIYKDIYEKNLYPDTWFMFDGKPLIIAPAEANIDDFFTTREPQWPNETQKRGAWPWIDWNWPQRIYRNKTNRPEAVSVSVAQHAGNSCFSSSALYGYADNWGRSFNGTNELLTADSYKLGLNIQNEFNYAMTVETPVVLVTGWNEWIASRQQQIKEGQPIVFIDTFNYEYSRDIEMSRGGYFDNYYMQLISNIRALKGSAPVVVQDARHLMNVTGSFGQWDKVTVSYSDPAGDTAERFSSGFGHNILVDQTGRNDIVEVKVTNDTTYLYFYVRTDDTIVRPDPQTESSWMQIFLNVDGEQTGWYGYDYILNHHPRNDLVTTLAAYSASEGYGFTDQYEVSYRVLGNEMMIAVPMEYLGITECDRVHIQFKVADSDTLIDEMEDFYIEGDAAPLGRPNFVYQTYIPGVTTGEGMPIVRLADKLKMDVTDDPDSIRGTGTEAVTDSESAMETTEPSPESETPVSAPDTGTDSETTAGKGGCRSVLSASALLALILLTVAVSVGRKRMTEKVKSDTSV